MQPPVTLSRRRDLGQILRDSTAYFARDWRGFVAIGAATIPFALASSAATIAIEDRLLEQAVILALFVLSLVPLAVIEGAVIAFLQAIDAGGDEREVEAFGRALRRTGPMAGAVLRLAAVCVPLSLLIIGLPLAVYFAIRWLFAPQAVMLDGTDGVQGLRASAALTRGEWWTTLGRVAVVGVLVIALNVAFLGVIASASEPLYALVSAILGAFTTPYFSIALTLMYFDLKLRKIEEAPAT